MKLSVLFERIFARRWIAGPGLDDALAIVRRLNSRGISAQINYLGEAFREKSRVKESVDMYLRIINEIKNHRLKADVALKLSEIGLGVGVSFARENYSKIVNFALSRGIFVWIDMEEHELIDDTLSIYRSFIKNGNVGVCIQSYLKRSEADLQKIARLGGVIRLVKGAYSESTEISYKEPLRTSNYLKLMDYLFAYSKKFMVATHDTNMIDTALELNKKYKRKVTYAMLLGVRNKYAIELAKIERVSIYVPFGERWTKYAFRRLREASNLKLIIKSLIKEPVSKV